jgi:hypothetical protein
MFGVVAVAGNEDGELKCSEDRGWGGEVESGDEKNSEAAEWGGGEGLRKSMLGEEGENGWKEENGWNETEGGGGEVYVVFPLPITPTASFLPFTTLTPPRLLTVSEGE